MEAKGSYFILLIVVAILTLTLAVLAGYLFLFAGTPQPKAEATETTETAITTAVTRPLDSELAIMKLYTEKQPLNLKCEPDKKTPPIILVNIQLQHYKKIKGLKSVEEKLTTYEGEIKELIGTYFQNVTIEEALKSDIKEKVKSDLKKKINDLLTASEKEKDEIVYAVIFDDWLNP